jgi:hypothetical protein
MKIKTNIRAGRLPYIDPDDPPPPPPVGRCVGIIRPR